ncbi:MAG: 2TM domain-containing protein [Cyanobacteria bacterium P01_A01_bin.135]
MPPKWPRKPDRNDPAFRRLDDRMTFATHVALFAAVNSSLWFFHLYRFPGWNWMPSFSLIWLAGLFVHAVAIFAIADYSGPSSQDGASGKGFGS